MPSRRAILVDGVLVGVIVVAVGAVVLTQSGGSSAKPRTSATPAESAPVPKAAETLMTPGAAIDVINAAGAHTSSALGQGESVAVTVTGFPASHAGMQSFVGECAILQKDGTVCDFKDISGFTPDSHGTAHARLPVWHTFIGTTDQGTSAGTVDCARVSGGCFLVALSAQVVATEATSPAARTKILARTTRPITFR